MNSFRSLPFAARAGHLLARVRYRQLQLTLEGRFQEASIQAERAHRLRAIINKVELHPPELSMERTLPTNGVLCIS